ncbi:23S rRNA (pseudouridine(1915)-N(3))-methyltransferase RlmH [candidate division KSB1 bacterium]|nr:23S rRNA (pseudouridine(1915)-N(3))-methyltransferase RlmH [candidate division KSB1 bacterium]
MQIKLLTVGKFSETCYGQLAEIYRRRISRYHSMEIVAVRAEKLSSLSPQEAMLREAKRILDRVRDADCCVILDIEGKTLDSLGLAEWLDRRIARGTQKLTFIIGGPFGLHSSVREAAQERLSLSSLTLAHELAAVVCLEQIYRACTILRGENYHK